MNHIKPKKEIDCTKNIRNDNGLNDVPTSYMMFHRNGKEWNENGHKMKV